MNWTHAPRTQYDAPRMSERRIPTGTLLVASMVIFALVIAVGRTVLIRFGNTYQPRPTTSPTTR